MFLLCFGASKAKGEPLGLKLCNIHGLGHSATKLFTPKCPKPWKTWFWQPENHKKLVLADEHLCFSCFLVPLVPSRGPASRRSAARGQNKNPPMEKTIKLHRKHQKTLEKPGKTSTKPGKKTCNKDHWRRSAKRTQSKGTAELSCRWVAMAPNRGLLRLARWLTGLLCHGNVGWGTEKTLRSL